MKQNEETSYDWTNYLEAMKHPGDTKGINKKFAQYYYEQGVPPTGKHVVVLDHRLFDNDAKYFHNLGFKVTMLHDNQCYNARVVQETFKQYPEDITVKIWDIYNSPIPKCDIVSAPYFLPFIRRDSFNPVWKDNITAQLNFEGYCIVHCFGEDHGWAQQWPKLTFMSEKEVLSLGNTEETAFLDWVTLKNGQQALKHSKKLEPTKDGGETLFDKWAGFLQKKSLLPSKEEIISSTTTFSLQSPSM